MTWVAELNAKLHGWRVWHSGFQRLWSAVPAPTGTKLREVYELPNRVTASTPQELLLVCQERYGWYDTCDSCGMLARDCGHRRPEGDKSS